MFNSPIYKHTMQENLIVETSEILRYMGCAKVDSEGIINLAERANIALGSVVTPKACYCIVNVKQLSDATVDLGFCSIVSSAFSTYMSGTELAIVFAATIGLDADRLIRRANNNEPSYALAIQAAGAAYIESYCDYLCQNELNVHASKQGLYLGHRFSAGYGDVSLEYQKAIFSALDCQRQIGLTLTDGIMMVPSKSVTAFVKMQDQKTCSRSNCRFCNQTDCEFRRG